MKIFFNARKKEFDILFMYYWTHDIYNDDNYWQEYREAVFPAIKDV